MKPEPFISQQYLPAVKKEPYHLRSLLSQNNIEILSDKKTEVKTLASLFRPIKDLVKIILDEENPVLSPVDWIRLVNINTQELLNVSHEAFLTRLWSFIFQRDPLQFQILWNEYSNMIFLNKPTQRFILSKQKFIKKAAEQALSKNENVQEILLHFFSPKPKESILKCAYHLKMVPWHYLISIKLPSTEETIMSLLEDLSKIIDIHHLKSSIDWLQSCLEETKNEQYEHLRLNVARALLDHLPSNLDHTRDIKGIVQWFHQYFNRLDKNSLWSRLNIDQQKRLLKWFGERSYGDFKKLIDKIKDIVTKNPIEINQLKKRSMFWSNYTNSFINIKIILPRKTVDILGNELNHFNIGEISILPERLTGISPEICIFETQKFLILEIFRGTNQTKIYENNPYYYDLLFNRLLNLDYLTNSMYHPIKEFSHTHLWQNRFYNWLLSQNMLVNDDISRLKIDQDYSISLKNGKLPEY